MYLINQHGFIEALLGQGWTVQQIEEVYAHRREDRFYGLWRAMVRVMTIRERAIDEVRRDKLLAVYSKLASVIVKYQ